MIRNLYYLLLFFFSVPSAQGQSFLPQIPETNGNVYGFAAHGNKLIIGGDFYFVFNRDSSNKYVAITDKNNGKFYGPNMPKTNNGVTASLADGQGGAFIAGTFNTFGDSARTGICHLNADGQVSNLLSGLGVSGQVNNMARYGDTLFLGGSFLKAGKNFYQSPSAIKINLNSNLQSPVFNSIDGEVTCSISDGKGGWFVGGTFKQVNGQSRSGICRVDSLGNLYPFNPNINGYPRALILKGDTLFAGGSFVYGGGQSRNNLIALNILTGAALGWNPNPNGEIWVLESYNNTLYVGGTYSSISGISRLGIAAYQMNSLVVKNWSLTFTGSTTVYAIHPIGNKVYIGGSFTNVKGLTRNNIACIDTLNATVLSWNPGASGSSNAIFTIKSNGNKLLVGGDFFTFGGQSRNHFVVTDTSNTLVVYSPNYSLNGGVSYMDIKGNSVYAVGYFTSVNGTSRNRAFEFDLPTSTFTSFNPNFNEGLSTCNISGNAIVCSFNINTYGGQASKCLVGVSISSGDLIWSPNPNFDVRDLEIANGQLYVVGAFTNINGTARNRACSFQLSSLALTPFNPNANNYIENIAVDEDSSAYLGGSFSTINGLTAQFLAKVNGNSGNIISGFGMTVNNSITSLALVSNKLWVSGNFSIINGSSRNYFAVLNKNTGAAITWPNAVSGTISKMIPMGNQMLLHGDFYSIGAAQNLNGAAIVDTANGAATNWRPTCSNTIVTACELGNKILLGSSSGIFGGQACNRLAELDLQSGNISSWRPDVNATIKAIDILGNQIYIGGDFTNINGIARTGLASFQLSTKSLTNWFPNLNTSSPNVYGLTHSNTDIFFCGYFFSVGGVSRNQIAAVDTLSGLTISFNPSIGGTPGRVLYSNNKLYAVGSFTNAGLATRNRACAFNVQTGALCNWNPNFNADPYGIQIVNNKAYIWGEFSSVNGIANTRGVVAVDTSNGLLLSGLPSFNASVKGFSYANGYLNCLGTFSTVGGLYVNGFVKLDTFGVIQPWGFRYTAGGVYINTQLFSSSVGLIAFIENSTVNFVLKNGMVGFNNQVFLPVKWKSFELSADKENNRAHLFWSTWQENNSSYFIVERSSDKIQFNPIQKIMAAGNSKTQRNYQYTDPLPEQNIHSWYYRIRQTDFDGSNSFSETRSIHWENPLIANIYPNPFENLIHIQSNEPIQTIVIYDLNGAVLKQIDLKSTAIEFQFYSDLGKGIYLLKVKSESGAERISKLIKY